MALTFYLLDQYMDIEQILDTYKSAIWSERYYETGDFELYLPATKDLIDAVTFDEVTSDKYICRADDTKKCGVIERITITTDVEEGNYLTIAGRTLASIPFRRIVLLQTTYTGSPKEIITKLLINSFVNPTDPDRQVNALKIAPVTLSSDDFIITAQFDGTNVGEAIEKLCRAYKIGFKIDFDISTKEMTFTMYEGTDRSTNQSYVPPVIFSNDFNNLLSSSYTLNRANMKTQALVAGEGEGTQRKKVEVMGRLGTGLDRSEIFVNAQTTSNNAGELTADAYEAALIQKGRDALAGYKLEEESEGDVAPNYGFILNQDYFLGDIVSVKNEYGIEMAPRVVEIIEAQDDTGYSCIPTFATD